MDPSTDLIIRILCFLPLLLFTIPRLIYRDTRQRGRYVILTIIALIVTILIPITCLLIQTDSIHVDHHALDYRPGWFSYILTRILMGCFLLLICIILPCIGMIQACQQEHMLPAPVPQNHSFFHVRTIFTYLCLFIEMLQLLAIPFYISTIPPSHVDMKDGISWDRTKMGPEGFQYLPWPFPTYFSYSIGLALDLDIMYYIFWLCFVYVWLGCVLPRILWESYLLRRQVWVQAWLPTKTYESFFVIPTVALCIIPLDCSYVSSTLQVNTFYPTWQCHTDNHLTYVIPALLTLWMYIPIACGMSSTPEVITWKHVDARYLPHYIQIQQAFKVALILFVLILSHVSISITLSIGILIHFLLLLITYMIEPAVILSLRILKSITHCMCIWTYLCIFVWRLINDLESTWFLPVCGFGFVVIWVSAGIWAYIQHTNIDPIALDLRARLYILSFAHDIFPKHEKQFEDVFLKPLPKRPLQGYCAMLLDERYDVANAALNVMFLAEPYILEQLPMAEHQYVLLTLVVIQDQIHMKLDNKISLSRVEQRIHDNSVIDPNLQAFTRLRKRIAQFAPPSASPSTGRKSLMELYPDVFIPGYSSIVVKEHEPVILVGKPAVDLAGKALPFPPSPAVPLFYFTSNDDHRVPGYITNSLSNKRDFPVLPATKPKGASTSKQAHKSMSQLQHDEEEMARNNSLTIIQPQTRQTSATQVYDWDPNARKHHRLIPRQASWMAPEEL